jgi:hypothetical protein
MCPVTAGSSTGRCNTFFFAAIHKPLIASLFQLWQNLSFFKNSASVGRSSAILFPVIRLLSTSCWMHLRLRRLFLVR